MNPSPEEPAYHAALGCALLERRLLTEARFPSKNASRRPRLRGRFLRSRSSLRQIGICLWPEGDFEKVLLRCYDVQPAERNPRCVTI